MIIDRSSKIPIYIQIKDFYIDQIKKNILKPGNYLPTEDELCKTLGISRYPIRQAMDGLVSEGYIKRVKGRGTFVDPELKIKLSLDTHIGLILISQKGKLLSDILNGFEKHARENNLFVSYAATENSPDIEIMCINRMISQGINNIALFPSDRSRLSEYIDKYKKEDVKLVLIDRNAGIEDIDYVGSDNFSGAYMAVRHLALMGFSNIIFVSLGEEVSSIDERLNGYMKAAEDYGLKEILRTSTDKDLRLYPPDTHKFQVEQLKENIRGLSGYEKIGVFAVNDHAAIQCIDILEYNGYEIGVNAAVVGFDDEPQAGYHRIPLTTISQNGVLIGKEAASILIDKSIMHKKTTVPTQIITRKSCGE